MLGVSYDIQKASVKCLIKIKMTIKIGKMYSDLPTGPIRYSAQKTDVPK